MHVGKALAAVWRHHRTCVLEHLVVHRLVQPQRALVDVIFHYLQQVVAMFTTRVAILLYQPGPNHTRTLSRHEQTRF